METPREPRHGARPGDPAGCALAGGRLASGAARRYSTSAATQAQRARHRPPSAVRQLAERRTRPHPAASTGPWPWAPGEHRGPFPRHAPARSALNAISRFIRDEDGQDVVEYGLLIVAVSFV